MKQLLLLSFAALLLAVPASAQWDFVSTFPPIEELQFSSTHGIAVDPDGKIWIQPFGATDSVSVNGTFQLVRVLYVFEADGSAAAISPIKFVDFADGVTPRDTLGGFTNAMGVFEGKSGRGLRADCAGNILVSQFDVLYKLDYETGQGLGRVVPSMGNALGEATSDSDCNVYVGTVFGGNPIAIYDPNFNPLGNVTDASATFSRSNQVAPDGLTFFETDFENPYTIIHTRPDIFSSFDSTGVTLRGMRVESSVIQPETGLYWFSSGDPLSGANEDSTVVTSWDIQTWYAFELADLLANEVPTPVDSIKWNEPANNPNDETAGPRPRGIAFSPDGNTAYIAAFNQPGPSVQKFINTNVAIEENGTSAPERFAIGQNYPNPFRGTTRIEFDLPTAGHVALRVYDVRGREVAVLVDEVLAARSYTAVFDAAGLATGTYLYVLELDGRQLSSNRMMLVK